MRSNPFETATPGCQGIFPVGFLRIGRSDSRSRGNASLRAPPAAAPLHPRPFWTGSGAHALLGMGFWMFVVFPLHLERLGAEASRIGVLIALEPAAAVMVRPMLGHLMSHRGRRW